MRRLLGQAVFSEYGAGAAAATLEDVARLSPEERMGGWPLLRQREAQGHGKMVRTHRWKYVHDMTGEVDELYDLEADPWELENLAGPTRARGGHRRDARAPAGLDAGDGERAARSRSTSERGVAPPHLCPRPEREGRGGQFDHAARAAATRSREPHRHPELARDLTLASQRSVRSLDFVRASLRSG